jgi:hypothetical protein
MKLLKKSIAAIIVVVLCLSLSLSASAEFQQPSLFLTNITQIDLNLSFSGSTAECNLDVTGISSTTELSGQMTLIGPNGNVLKTWTFNEDSRYLNFEKSFTVSTPGTYTLSCTVTAQTANSSGSATRSDTASYS